MSESLNDSTSSGASAISSTSTNSTELYYFDDSAKAVAFIAYVEFWSFYLYLFVPYGAEYGTTGITSKSSIADLSTYVITAFSVLTIFVFLWRYMINTATPITIMVIKLTIKMGNKGEVSSAFEDSSVSTPAIFSEHTMS